MGHGTLQIQKQLLEKIGQLLSEAGFSRQSKRNYLLRIDPYVVGLLGVNVITEPGNDEGVNISVVLGLRHQALEELVCRLTGQRLDPRATATLSVDLGYVTPENSYLVIPVIRDTISTVAEELSDTVVRYGVSWMVSHASPDTMLSALMKGQYTYHDASRLRVPALLYLKADFAGAERLVKEHLSAIGESRGPVSDQYRRYAEGLLRLLRQQVGL